MNKLKNIIFLIFKNKLISQLYFSFINKKSYGGLSGVAIAGIVIVSVDAFLAIIIITLCCLRQRNPSKIPFNFFLIN